MEKEKAASGGVVEWTCQREELHGQRRGTGREGSLKKQTKFPLSIYFYF